ncbi:MAG: hypothetical protein HZA07_02330 [Nitrospirae bacterium]|nr:hypothetical protein [Nitrospirota bacterium]
MEEFTLEQQIALAGIYYPRSYDITYRAGWIIQCIGAFIFSGIYIFRPEIPIFAIPAYIIGLIIFETGIAISALFLLVWKAEIKRFILWCVFAGIVTQILSIILKGPIQHSIFVIGVGMMLAGANGLVGKEFYCFRFIEGLILFVLYPIIVFINLFYIGGHTLNAFLYGLSTILLSSFTRKKLSQPLLKKCKGGVCVLPESGEK